MWKNRHYQIFSIMCNWVGSSRFGLDIGAHNFTFSDMDWIWSLWKKFESNPIATFLYPYPIVADTIKSGKKREFRFRKTRTTTRTGWAREIWRKKSLQKTLCRRQRSYDRIKTKYSWERLLPIFSSLTVSFCLQYTKIFYRPKCKHCQSKRNHISNLLQRNGLLW